MCDLFFWVALSAAELYKFWESCHFLLEALCFLHCFFAIIGDNLSYHTPQLWSQAASCSWQGCHGHVLSWTHHCDRRSANSKGIALQMYKFGLGFRLAIYGCTSCATFYFLCVCVGYDGMTTNYLLCVLTVSLAKGSRTGFLSNLPVNIFPYLSTVDFNFFLFYVFTRSCGRMLYWNETWHFREQGFQTTSYFPEAL